MADQVRGYDVSYLFRHLLKHPAKAQELLQGHNDNRPAFLLFLASPHILTPIHHNLLSIDEAGFIRKQ